MDSTYLKTLHPKIRAEFIRQQLADSWDIQQYSQCAEDVSSFLDGDASISASYSLVGDQGLVTIQINTTSMVINSVKEGVSWKVTNAGSSWTCERAVTGAGRHMRMASRESGVADNGWDLDILFDPADPTDFDSISVPEIFHSLYDDWALHSGILQALEAVAVTDLESGSISDQIDQIVSSIDPLDYPQASSVLQMVRDACSKSGSNGVLYAIQQLSQSWENTVVEDDGEQTMPAIAQWEPQTSVSGIVTGIVSIASSVIGAALAGLTGGVSLIISAIIPTVLQAVTTEVEGEWVDGSQPYFGSYLEFRIPKSSSDDLSWMLNKPIETIAATVFPLSDNGSTLTIRVFFRPTGFSTTSTGTMTGWSRFSDTYIRAASYADSTKGLNTTLLRLYLNRCAFENVAVSDEQMRKAYCLAVQSCMVQNQMIWPSAGTRSIVCTSSQDADAIFEMCEASAPTWDQIAAFEDSIAKDDGTHFNGEVLYTTDGLKALAGYDNWPDFAPDAGEFNGVASMAAYGSFGVRYNGPSVTKAAVLGSLFLGLAVTAAAVAAVGVISSKVRRWRFAKSAKSQKRWDQAQQAYSSGSISSSQLYKERKRYTRSQTLFGSSFGVAQPARVMASASADNSELLQKLDLIIGLIKS